MKFLKKKHLISIIFFIFIGLSYFIFIKFEEEANKQKYKSELYRKVYIVFNKFPDPIKSLIMIATGQRNYNNLANDYNVKFLPETEHIKLNLKKIKTSFSKKNGSTFFIETYDKFLIIASKKGEFYRVNLLDLKNDKIKNIDQKLEVRNLKITQGSINDLLIVKDKIYVLKATFYKDCNNLQIFFSDIKDTLNFKLFKSFDECVGKGLVAGGMQYYKYKDQDGLIISTSSPSVSPQSAAQDPNSILGKILFIDFKKKEKTMISMGHRNPQGLASKDNIILSTEHGPKGGDEINKIIYGKNYGWPISSYGTPYKSEMKDIQDFKKSHKEFGFEEPIYVFLSSIGISELIFLPNTFSKKWKNSVLVSSLNGRSIYRINFLNSNYENILYKEQILIGERIRDISYNKKFNFIILALEDSGVVGLLSEKK